MAEFERDVSFDDFVSSQTKQKDENKIDWQEEKREWLEYLDQLYKTIEYALEEYTKKSLIETNYSSVSIEEENIGKYEARQLNIEIGRKKIAFVPVGTLLIGSKGRVDVIGPFGKARIALVHSNSTGWKIKSTYNFGDGRNNRKGDYLKNDTAEVDWKWKVITSPPQISFIDLSPEMVRQIIMEVSNG